MFSAVCSAVEREQHQPDACNTYEGERFGITEFAHLFTYTYVCIAVVRRRNRDEVKGPCVMLQHDPHMKLSATRSRRKRGWVGLALCPWLFLWCLHRRQIS